MSWNGWETRPDGSIILFPVIGWSTGTAMKGMAGMLRVELVTDPSLKNISAVQMGLTVSQVEELRDALGNLLDKLKVELIIDKPSGPAS